MNSAEPAYGHSAAESAAILPAVSSRTAAETGLGVVLSGSGLRLPQRLPFERWLGIGRQLSAMSTSVAWCLGDWLAYGEQAYSGRYRHALEQTSLDYQTLRNYAWVARQFIMCRRRDSLSFGHHAEVAALPEPEQDYWLRKAEECHWPVKQLRRQVRASLAERSSSAYEQALPSHQDWVILNLRIRLSPDQLETCKAAADKANVGIQEWTALALEHIAHQQLGANDYLRPSVS